LLSRRARIAYAAELGLIGQAEAWMMVIEDVREKPKRAGEAEPLVAKILECLKSNAAGHLVNIPAAVRKKYGLQKV
jgi:hypothetical protein